MQVQQYMAQGDPTELSLFELKKALIKIQQKRKKEKKRELVSSKIQSDRDCDFKSTNL